VIIVEAAGQALAAAFNMLWEVLWPLALGFILSAIVQTLDGYSGGRAQAWNDEWALRRWIGLCLEGVVLGAQIRRLGSGHRPRNHHVRRQ